MEHDRSFISDPLGGKVFYLMADSNTLSARIAERDGVADRDALLREILDRAMP